MYTYYIYVDLRHMNAVCLLYLHFWNLNTHFSNMYIYYIYVDLRHMNGVCLLCVHIGIEHTIFKYVHTSQISGMNTCCMQVICGRLTRKWDICVQYAYLK